MSQRMRLHLQPMARAGAWQLSSRSGPKLRASPAEAMCQPRSAQPLSSPARQRFPLRIPKAESTLLFRLVQYWRSCSARLQATHGKSPTSWSAQRTVGDISSRIRRAAPSHATMSFVPPVIRARARRCSAHPWEQPRLRLQSNANRRQNRGGSSVAPHGRHCPHTSYFCRETSAANT